VMSVIAKNYLYDLPEDILVLIYKKAFKATLKEIEDMRETLDNYDRLVAYIKKNRYDEYKTHAIWSIMLCYRRDVGDPYYKYFLHYADSETDFLRLNKQKMCKYNPAYSSIKYLDFPIYNIKERITAESYRDVKKILEKYTSIYLSNYIETVKANEKEYVREYLNIKRLELCDNKIRIEYVDTVVFKCSIDIYINILETYNFIAKIFKILNIYNNLYPRYNLEFMNDLGDLREWFNYNSFFCGFTISDTSVSGVSGDTLLSRFYSARYT
jgi:hypothetical protein